MTGFATTRWSLILDARTGPEAGRVALEQICRDYRHPVLAYVKRHGYAPADAEDSGIAALAVHGRTRADQYQGEAEYETIAAIKQAIRIPVLANGDADSPVKAREVRRRTGADALMVGRAAHGRPWIFRELAHFLATGEELPPPTPLEVRDILVGHLEHLHEFYGEVSGVRIARKHLGWYAKDRPENARFRAVVNAAETAEAQLRLTNDYFERLAAEADHARCAA
jgi:tRNA-dihydrouridine synthase B